MLPDLIQRCSSELRAAFWHQRISVDWSMTLGWLLGDDQHCDLHQRLLLLPTPGQARGRRSPSELLDQSNLAQDIASALTLAFRKALSLDMKSSGMGWEQDWLTFHDLGFSPQESVEIILVFGSRSLCKSQTVMPSNLPFTRKSAVVLLKMPCTVHFDKIIENELNCRVGCGSWYGGQRMWPSCAKT